MINEIRDRRGPAVSVPDPGESVITIRQTEGTSMADVIVHGIPGSRFARPVRMALVEKQAPWRPEGVRPGMLKTPGHLGRHVFGRVPVIEHGDFRLHDTQAILRYLDTLFPGPALPRPEPRAIGWMNQIIGINERRSQRPAASHG